MSFSENSSDQDWKDPKMKIKSMKHDMSPASRAKYSQKFCEKWMNIFSPWLARCDDDPNKPFCKACQCRLDCNRCHLQRHERTSKHARNLEILINKGETAARQNLSIRQERSKYYQQRKKLYASTESNDAEMDTADEEYVEEASTEFQFVQADSNTSDRFPEKPILKQEPEVKQFQSFYRSTPKPSNKNSNIQIRTISSVKKPSGKKEPMQLLMQIQKDKNDLMDSFKEIVGSSFQQSPPREKNHVDLFFESVSSSVKALSPKLIAEAKMRVSQLICELELRALTDSDSNNSNNGNGAQVLVSQEGSAFIIGQPSNSVSSNETLALT